MSQPVSKSIPHEGVEHLTVEQIRQDLANWQGAEWSHRSLRGVRVEVNQKFAFGLPDVLDNGVRIVRTCTMTDSVASVRIAVD